MDTKQIEMIAENYISAILGKYKILVAKPLFDRKGVDLLVFIELKEHLRVGFVQNKGRSLIKGNSNIKINKTYVHPNFFTFFYPLLPSKEDKLYIFFADDIIKWEIKDENYYLNVPKNILSITYFKEHLFSEQKLDKLISYLKPQPGGMNISTFFDNETNILNYEYSKWIKTDITPTLLTLKYIWNLWEVSDTPLHYELFILICSYLESDYDSYDFYDDFPSFEFLFSLIQMKTNICKSIIEDYKVIEVNNFTSAVNDYYICYNYYFVSDIILKKDNKNMIGKYLFVRESGGNGYEIFLEKKDIGPLVLIRKINGNAEKIMNESSLQLVLKYKQCSSV